jgi:uncharacterized delta-60 repeat protein
VPGRPLPPVAIALAALLSSHLGTARAGLPGEPDPTFNAGLPVLLDLARAAPRRTALLGAAFDAQGRIVVTGSASDENGDPAVLLTRLGPDGALDASFGTIIQLGLGLVSPGPISSGADVAPRPGGVGWLVVGDATAYEAEVCPVSGLVVAFDGAGQVDVGYGTGGVARPHPASPTQNCFAGRGVVAPDGTAYVTGTVYFGSDQRFALTKVTPAGLIDMSFGNAGGSYIAEFSEGTQKSSAGASAIVTPAGVLALGGTGALNNNGQLLLLRLNSAGSLDPTFGAGAGFVRVQVGDPTPNATASQGRAIAVGPDAEVYVAGRALDPNVSWAMSITRFSPRGAVDGLFATLGTRRLQPDPAPGRQSDLNDFVVQPDGKVVAVGVTDIPLDPMPEGVVLRLDVDGNLDPTFGQNGIVRLSYGAETYANRVRLSPDAESVVVTGATFDEAGDGRGFATRILLVPRTTTTTLPGNCAAAPSLAGARCRLGLLGTAIAAAVPPGKLSIGLGGLVAGTDGRLEAAGQASGMAVRRKLKRALKPLRALRGRLASKAARTGIAEAQRADLIAQTDTLASEVQALAAAS